VSLAAAVRRRTVFVTGKGGVGKTSLVAALGELRCAGGERILLVELDHAASSLAEIYDTESGPVPHPTQVDGLSICNLQWEDNLDEYLAELLQTRRIARAVTSFGPTRRLLEALPFGREVVMLWSLVRLHREGQGRFDALVVDLPASGHAVGLFSTARSIQRLFRVGTPIREQAVQIEEMLGSQSAGLLLVAIPEEMSVTETRDTAAEFRALSFPPLLGVVLNRYPVDAPDPAHDQSIELLESHAGELSERARETVEAARASVRERQRAEEAYERLVAGLGSMVSRLPLRVGSGRQLIRPLVDDLRALVARS
jgi:anion-transporting  ArsA/GET3 family ATPase